MRALDLLVHELTARTGVRIYYTAAGNTATVLIAGNKSSQQRDIARAKRRMK